MNTVNAYTISMWEAACILMVLFRKVKKQNYVLEVAADGYYRIYTEDKTSCLSVKDGMKSNEYFANTRYIRRFRRRTFQICTQ